VSTKISRMARQTRRDRSRERAARQAAVRIERLKSEPPQAPAPPPDADLLRIPNLRPGQLRAIHFTHNSDHFIAEVWPDPGLGIFGVPSARDLWW